jgi:hypothetical protein
MLCLLGAVAATSGVLAAQEPAGSTAAIVKSYLAIQSRLAADSLDDVQADASRIAAGARTLGQTGAGLAAAADAVAKAADLNAAREAFGPLSEAVIARVKADTAFDPGPGLRLAWCPMVRRSWLQREEQVRNPYYGKQMLTCGELKRLR